MGNATKNGRTNSSRFEREVAIANDLLKSVEPQIKSMSTRELFVSIKSLKNAGDQGPEGVGYYLCLHGNYRVIRELKLRPKGELEALRWADNSDRVFTGSGGQEQSKQELLNELLADAP
jgi:hypothetical protein